MRSEKRQIDSRVIGTLDGQEVTAIRINQHGATDLGGEFWNVFRADGRIILEKSPCIGRDLRGIHGLKIDWTAIP